MWFWEHNGHKKYWSKKPGFLDRNILTCDTRKCIFWFYQLKPKICNLAMHYAMSDICHIIMHHARCDDFAVHISVLLLKQNICWHHKTIELYKCNAWNIVPISHFRHGFKTRHKNMQMGVIKWNLIFAYVNRLNPFHPICTTPQFFNGTARRRNVTVWMQDV